jgi:hypothetical protein
MIEFGGIIYQLDLGAFNEAIKVEGQKPNDDISEKSVKTYLDEKNATISTEVVETFRKRGVEIDSTKYEILRMLIDVIMDDMDDEPDDSLGIERVLSKKPLSYRIAFNTLKQYNILTEI